MNLLILLYIHAYVHSPTHKCVDASILYVYTFMITNKYFSIFHFVPKRLLRLRPQRPLLLSCSRTWSFWIFYFFVFGLPHFFSLNAFALLTCFSPRVFLHVLWNISFHMAELKPLVFPKMSVALHAANWEDLGPVFKNFPWTDYCVHDRGFSECATHITEVVLSAMEACIPFSILFFIIQIYCPPQQGEVSHLHNKEETYI